MTYGIVFIFIRIADEGLRHVRHVYVTISSLTCSSIRSAFAGQCCITSVTYIVIIISSKIVY